MIGFILSLVHACFYLLWIIFFFINFFLTSDKLLIESTKSGDYEILKKGAERADGINDVEEFKITEVSVLLQKEKQRLKFTRNLGNPSLHHRCIVTPVSNVCEALPISSFWARSGPKLLEMQLNFSST